MIFLDMKSQTEFRLTFFDESCTCVVTRCDIMINRSVDIQLFIRYCEVTYYDSFFGLISMKNMF